MAACPPREPGWQPLLDEALELSCRVNNQQRLGVVDIARAEAAWLAADRDAVLREADAIYRITVENRQPAFAAELAYWRWQAGERVETTDWMVQPFVLEIHGDWRGAATAWEALGCAYEQARALSGGDREAQKTALVIFEQLGARPMAEWVRQKLIDAGAETIPRGPRTTTRKNPFGLTNRQLEVLALLAQNLTNAEIGARLHISPKTVDHHVSAVLARLDVPRAKKLPSWPAGTPTSICSIEIFPETGNIDVIRICGKSTHARQFGAILGESSIVSYAH